MADAVSKLHEILDDLIKKYKDNEYVSTRLSNYIERTLPGLLEYNVIIQKQRTDKKRQLTNDHEEFISRFLNKNEYFYSSYSELFLYYDGIHFTIFNEDDIHHKILSMITNENILMQWKHKTNNSILKKIKDKSPIGTIPESTTIQFVIGKLYPEYFPSRNTAKYFLTIIGDCINAKQTGVHSTLIYIINPLLKELMREISIQCYSFFGIPTILNNIKYKFHDHNLMDVRLVKHAIQTNKIICTELSKHMIDLLCVASHYSSRYGSADGFLDQCHELKLVEHALYLTKTASNETLDTADKINKAIKENILSNFINKKLTPLNNSKISFKNMNFLWRLHITDECVPNVIFQTSFKLLLKDKLKYDEETDSYLDVTSTYLPNVSSFIKFWDATITFDSTNDYEIELDELVDLYKHWSNKNNCIQPNIMIELLQHFYQKQITDNRYVHNIKCTVWDKYADVINSLELFKLKCSELNEKSASLYDAYIDYVNTKHAFFVSKSYFDRVSIEVLGNYISDEIISAKWWDGGLGEI